MRNKPTKKVDSDKFSVKEELSKAMGPLMNSSEQDLQKQLEQKCRRIQQLSAAATALYGTISRLMDLSRVPLSTSKDPLVLLQVCGKLCEIYANAHRQPTANAEEVLRNVLENHPGNCQQAEYAAAKALENHSLTRELAAAHLQIGFLETKLSASEQSCQKITQSATETIDTMKDEFDKAVSVLEATEQHLNETLALQNSTEIERKKLAMLVEDLRRSNKRSKDPVKTEERQLEVIRNQFEKKVQSIEKAYRSWWNERTSHKTSAKH